MTYKDKMALTVLLKCRARTQLLIDDVKDDFRYNYLQGGYDALCLAISLLRCPLGVLIKVYDSIENGNTK